MVEGAKIDLEDVLVIWQLNVKNGTAADERK